MTPTNPPSDEVMCKEEWKWIPGYEGRYKVSSHGQVRSVNRQLVNACGSPRFYPSKMKTQRNQNGYQCVDLWNKKGTTQRVHRLVALAFLPNESNFPVVNHLDGCKTNNMVSNLEWTDHKGNSQHAYDMGLICPTPMHGATNGRAKLTDKQVSLIRSRSKDGVSNREQADSVGVHITTIQRIVKGELWRI